MSLVNLAHVCSHLQNASAARLSITSISLTKLHLALALALQRQGFISSVQVAGKDPPTPMPDTILPNDAETLTYSDYRQLMKMFKTADSSVKSKMPWSWYTPTSSSHPSTASAGQTGSAQDSVPSPEPRLSILEELEYSERPWMWLYRNSIPTPLADYIADPSLLLSNTRQSLISYEQWSLMPNSLAHGHQTSSPPLLSSEPWRCYPDPHPFFASERGQLDPWANVPRNPAQRRLWLGLKYWSNEPVLSKMKLVSKPTRKFRLRAEEIAKVTRGNMGRSDEGILVKGMTKIGECLFVNTKEKGLIESRECIERGLGGMPLVRTW